MYGKGAFLFALCLVGLSWMAPITTGQPSSISYTTSLSFSAAQETDLPFWLATNRFGTIDPTGAGGTLRFNAFTAHDPGKSISYAFGADLVGRVSPQSTLFLQQFYGELQAGPFLLRAGRKEETAGMVHPTLSLGSMTVSPNAAPLTQVNISWPKYVGVPGTNEFVSIKGSISHGWFEGNRIVNNAFLHEKSVYLRVGGKDWPIRAYGGIMHYATWGGTHINPRIGQLPSSFGDFWRVFFVQGASADNGLDPEVSNVLGNALGAYDFKLDISLERIFIQVYRQFYLEDTVSMAFRNVHDGLWGLSFDFQDRPAGIRHVLYEHVNTKRQSSKQFEIDAGLIGTDNYYNHGVYSSGWTHRGRTIGMPLVLTGEGYHGVVNNILLGHHIALHGELPENLLYTVFFTYTRSYGAHSILDSQTLLRTENSRTPAQHRYSTMLDLSLSLWPASQIDGFVRLAYDWVGQTDGFNNFGATVGLIRRGNFN